MRNSVVCVQAHDPKVQRGGDPLPTLEVFKAKSAQMQKRTVQDVWGLMLTSVPGEPLVAPIQFMSVFSERDLFVCASAALLSSKDARHVELFSYPSVPQPIRLSVSSACAPLWLVRAGFECSLCCLCIPAAVNCWQQCMQKG